LSGVVQSQQRVFSDRSNWPRASTLAQNKLSLRAFFAAGGLPLQMSEHFAGEME